ncbi:expressed unknown protein [Seminavis robusta]|uniref:Uncharacterized protein n=1 Tax=Seminavis robusta TaxID=568900 RepID=A0A9N8HIV9_9STRA|nr:expressed unknown protein [Seminavis robusta]|eukprot:Sro813_g206140.1 n/a (260) ;mRNA; f:10616-11395
MKFTPFFSTILATSFIIGTSAGTTAIRGTNNDNGEAHRKLVSFDTILSLFTPVLDVVVRGALGASLDPLGLSLTVSQDVDLVVFSDSCTSSATVTYNIGDLTGLGNFVVDNLAIVDGSADIDVSLFWGTSWEATFNVEGGLPEGLEAIVDAEITADACGVPFQQSVSGLLDAVDARVNFSVGTSGSIPGFFGSPSVESATFADVDVTLGGIETSIDFDGVEVDLTTSGLEGAIIDAIIDTIVGPFADILNGALGGGFSL